MKIKQLASTLLLMIMSTWLSMAFAVTTPIYKTNEAILDLGFDIFPNQTVAIRFSPNDTVTLNFIEVWFMNNSGNSQGEVLLTLVDDEARDDGHSQPSDTVIEEWRFNISSQGWVAEKETVHSQIKPVLEYNKRYWLVAKSDAPIFKNPVWSMANGLGDDIVIAYNGFLFPGRDIWQVGYGAMPAVRIHGDIPVNP